MDINTSYEEYEYEYGSGKWQLFRPRADMTLILDLYQADILRLKEIYSIVKTVVYPEMEIIEISKKVVYFLENDNIYNRKELMEISMAVFNKMKRDMLYIEGIHGILVRIAGAYNSLKKTNSSPPAAPRKHNIPFMKKAKDNL
jgi:hypothetical protein